MCIRDRSCTDKDIDGSYYYARVNAVNVSDNPVDEMCIRDRHRIILIISR